LYGRHKDGKNHLYGYTPSNGDITEITLIAPYSYTALAEDNNGPLYHADGSIYFFAYNGLRHSLWKTNGTNGGTALVYSLPNKAFSILDNSYYSIEDSTIAFVGEVSSLGYQVILKDLSTGYSASLVDPTNKKWTNPQSLRIYNGRIYFTAKTENGQGLGVQGQNIAINNRMLAGSLYLPATPEKEGNEYTGRFTVHLPERDEIMDIESIEKVFLNLGFESAQVEPVGARCKVYFVYR